MRFVVANVTDELAVGSVDVGDVEHHEWTKRSEVLKPVATDVLKCVESVEPDAMQDIEVGDWVFFDLGYGPESGKVQAVRATEVDVGIPVDGERTLSRGEVYPTATEAAHA